MCVQKLMRLAGCFLLYTSQAGLCNIYGVFHSWGPSATGGLIAKNAKRKAVHINNAVHISGPAVHVVDSLATWDANVREQRCLAKGNRGIRSD